MILVSQDAAGLEAAALEMMKRELTGADVEHEAAEDVMPYQLSPGYYHRVEYLLQLEEMMKAGATFDLYADEVTGLSALKRARGTFSREHPACGQCGAAQWSRFVGSCHECGAKFKRGA